MKIFNRKSNSEQTIKLTSLLPILFIAGRLILFLALIPNNLHGFGDFQVYFDSAALPGFPYFQSWSEYPPVFAWSVELVYLLAQGNQFVFDFLFYFILSVAGAASIWLVSEICKLLGFDTDQINLRSGMYFAFLAFCSYTWWYFDLVPVALMLAAIYSVLKNKDTATGIWLGLGILAKWFPVLLLPAVFRFRKTKSFIKIAAISVGITIIVWGIHLALSPTMTWASLQSQPSRSSWETIWALIDGNLNTGAFVPMEERIWPEAATFPRGNTAVIPSWITLLIFGCIGLYLLLHSNKSDMQAFVGLIGITWALFLLWSPGWSPQWILYIIPLILISVSLKSALGYIFALGLITVVEWPFLLSRRLFMGLWVVTPLRMLLLAILLVKWNKITRQIGTQSIPQKEF